MNKSNMRKILLCTLPVWLLAGCFAAKESQLVTKNARFDPQSQARIRLYGFYGKPAVRVYSGVSCDRWRETYGNRRFTRFNNGLPRRVRNISIGMPDTAVSVATQKDTGIIFRDSYMERVIRANAETVLDASFSAQTDHSRKSCRVAASFVPEAGADYEAKLLMNNNRCVLRVTRINGTQPDASGVVPVTEQPLREKCEKAKYSS